MTARPAVRVRRDRFSSALSCGHWAAAGSMITNLGDGCGWICSPCAVRLALDAIAAKQTQP